MTDISEKFESTDRDIFRFRKGPAFKEGGDHCQWKICLTATDESYLVKLLLDISEKEECFFVKYSPSGSPKCRDGMFLGRIFLSNEDQVGEMWRELRTDKKLMCSIQDDIVTKKFRSS